MSPVLSAGVKRQMSKTVGPLRRTVLHPSRQPLLDRETRSTATCSPQACDPRPVHWRVFDLCDHSGANIPDEW